MSHSVLLCMGTRPEIIKMAPVYHALKANPAFAPLVLHTGQHTDLAQPLYDFFEMKPDVALDLQRERPSLGHLSALMMDRIDRVFDEARPESILVHGDTSSALMAALAAFYHKIPVGHVEAGLRSHNPMDPFPEEMNRTMLARLAKWHFAPTERAEQNLRFEGVAAHSIHRVGNTIVDATRWGMDRVGLHFRRATTETRMVMTEMAKRVARGRLVLVTAHRRENWGRPMEDIANGVRELATTHEDLHFVWPLHPNPVVRRSVASAMTQLPANVRERMMLIEPLNYPQMLWALRHAWLVMTDSGGIQEEAAALDVPVLVLRGTTERPELIEVGGGALVGTEKHDIVSAFNRLYWDERAYHAMHSVANPFGDGTSAVQIARILEHELNHVLQMPTAHALSHAA